jgi:short-subunit dehydrogenase
MNQDTKKVAWVTGASSGIGYETALRLVKDGWHVAVTARSQDKLEEMARASGYVHAFAGDITDASAMETIVARIEKEIGAIDLALLCAGTYYRDGIKEFKAETIIKQYEINIFGTMKCLEPVFDRFKARDKGHIAIVSSVAGYRGLPHSLAYGSGKAALINFCESLAIHCRGSGIKVQLISPGFVKTPLTDKNEFPMPMLMDADVAADKLVKGLSSNKFEITFPWAFALILKTLGLLPARLYIALLSKARESE